ncbi:hypothetical protein GGF46_003143 [Coemansia sp. RSA 552]|nr:hypothetical protein GGF46_003143 [Coemansia sp. RSA 552]
MDFDVNAFVRALGEATPEALAALPEIQKQAEAWQLAFTLLGTDNATCRFFGAHTLQAKIMQDWATLDAEQQRGLREELQRVAAENSDGAASVVGKINQALIAYALQAEWAGFLGEAAADLVRRAAAAGKSAAAAGSAVVDLLDQFPEELRRAALGQTRARQAMSDARAGQAQVLRVLAAAAEIPAEFPADDGVEASVEAAAAAAAAADEQVRVRAWRGVQQWVQFGVADAAFVQLLDAGLRRLQALADRGDDGDDDETRAAAAAIEDMVGNARMAAAYSRSVGSLALQHLGAPWMRRAVERAAAQQSAEDARAWGAVLVAFGEAHTEFIVGRVTDADLGGAAATYLQTMLALMRFPGVGGVDEDASDQALGFWYLLQEALADYETETDAADAASVEAAAETRAAVSGVFGELVQALVDKTAQPAWHDAPREARERFGAYRRDAGDALLNAYYVLRDDMLGALVNEALGALASAEQQQARVDALLFALRSIAEAVPSDEAAHLPRLFAPAVVIGRLQPLVAHAAPAAPAAIALLGAYSDWLRAHAGLLPSAIACVTCALSQPALVSTAVGALRQICDSCRTELGDAADALVALAADALRAPHVSPREQQRVVEAVAEVVGARPPESHAATLAPLLRALADSEPRSAESSELLTLTHRLRLADALARGLQFADDVEEHALAGDSEARAALETAAQSYSASPELAEFRRALVSAAARALELVRNAPPEAGDTALESILALINSAVRRSPHALAPSFADAVALVGCAWADAVACDRWADRCPPLLATIAQLVGVFGAPANPVDSDPELGAALTRAIDDIGAALGRDADTLPRAIEQQPVVAEALFDLATRVVHTRPQLLLNAAPPAVARLCVLSLAALAVPTRLALKPVAAFLTAAIRLASPKRSLAPLPALWAEYGPAWLRATLVAIGGAHPRSLLPALAELLFAIVKNHPGDARAWLPELLGQADFPSAHATPDAKHQLVRQVLGTRSFARAKAAISEFSIHCRNLQGTAYAS